MRKITKGEAPYELNKWVRSHPNKKYADLGEDETGVKPAIRDACLKKQYGLCAHCCKPITADNSSSHNEHVVAQRIDQNRTTDFTNIVASCETPNQCGKAHGHQPLPLTPLMDECETELKFSYSGRVRGTTARADENLDVLKLQSRSLNAARKLAIEALQYEFGTPPEEAAELDADIIKILLAELAPQKGCDLKPYAPVLVNILEHELEGMQG